MSLRREQNNDEQECGLESVASEESARVPNVGNSGNVPEIEDTLGRLEWVRKRYPFGGLKGGLVSGVLMVAAVFMFFGVTVSSSVWPAAGPMINSYHLDLASAISIAVGIASLSILHLAYEIRHAVRRGFYPTSKRTGLLKDGKGGVAFVIIGGPGTICAKRGCGGRLGLKGQALEPEAGNFLVCERDPKHRWKFDQTTVGDGVLAASGEK